MCTTHLKHFSCLLLVEPRQLHHAQIKQGLDLGQGGGNGVVGLRGMDTQQPAEGKGGRGREGCQ
jgi:hypothetical protein